MSKFAHSSKNREKMEKSQFLLKLLNSKGKGGRRVPRKNCDFCNFSKNCGKIGEIAGFAKVTKCYKTWT